MPSILPSSRPELQYLSMPSFANVEEERLHRKQRLAAALPAVLEVRLRRGRRRSHHGARPRAARPLLGQPVRACTSGRSGSSDLILVNDEGEVVEGKLAGQRGRLRHPLAGARGPPRRGRRRPLPLAARQGVVVAAAGRSTRSRRTRARSTATTRCSTTTPASCSTSRRASASPTPSATTRRSSSRNHGLLTVGHDASTRRRGGSSPWSAPARRSCSPRPPARRC